MRLKYQQIIAVLLLALVACTSATKYPDKVKAIDSLHTQLVATEAYFKSLDTVKVYKMQKELESSFQNFKANKPDTLGKEDAKLLNDFLKIKNTADNFTKKYSAFIGEISYTKKQLNALKHDLDKNLVDSDEVDEFYGMEYREANKIISTCSLVVRKVNESITAFDTTLTPMNHFIDSLKTAGQTPK